MDTLVIVRKIREAEALADSGKHGDARRLLEPLLADDGLTETHRKLVTKKLDLFKKQQERMTRIISRRGTAISVRDTANESSERTAIRKPLEDKEKSERPTDLTIERGSRRAEHRSGPSLQQEQRHLARGRRTSGSEAPAGGQRIAGTCARFRHGPDGRTRGRHG
jgi:hypothetical protein